MELRRYALLLWRWLWLILLGAVLGGAAAFGVSWQTTPVYESSTTLLISQARASNASPDYTALLTSERLAKTYAELLRKRPVLDAVIARLQLSTDAETLATHVRTSAVRDTQLLVLTVDATSPQRAADIANQIVDVFGQQNRDLQTGRYAESERILVQELAKVQIDIDKSQAGLDALTPPLGAAALTEQARLQALQAQQKDSYTSLLKSLQEIRLAEVQTTDSVNVVESAKAELTPARPRTIMNTLLGAIVGLMLALGVVLLVEYLDDTVKSSEGVAELIDTMTLSTIAQIGGKEPYQKLVAITDPRAAIAEAYRMLRVNVDFASIDRPARTLLVTSSGPGEGKSTTAANLAIAIAQAGKRVILVDADLRRPTLHKIFRLSAERGVTTALLQSGTPLESHVARTGIRNLTLMPSGPLPPNPSELLGSQRMTELTEQLRQRADVVVFDSPPALPVVDATILASACDATLRVVLAKKTRSGALRRTREQLAQSGAHVLGVVLNRVPNARGSAYYSYYTDGRSDKRLRATSLPFMRNEQAAPAQSWVEKSQLVEAPDANSNGVAP